MADDALIRLNNFRKLFEPFSPKEVALKLWGTPSQWSDLYHGRKSFGEKIARKIEDKLGLVRLCLDDPAGPKTPALSAEVLAAIDTADPAVKRQCVNVLRSLLGLPQLGASASSPPLSSKVAA